MDHAHPGNGDCKPERLDLNYRACMDSTEMDVPCACFSCLEAPEIGCLHPESRKVNPGEAVFLEAVLHEPVS